MTSIDRLSGLPNELICHILSFLPTKLSVATSALAKKWRFLWVFVRNLYFHRRDFREETQISDIIHRVIVLHEAKTINGVVLYNVNCNDYQLETWITYAVHRSVRNLYVGFHFDEYPDMVLFALPRCLLTCKTLVQLKLDLCEGVTSSGEVFLPSLRKLHLRYVAYEDGESLPHLLSGCPVLQELIIDYCFREDQTNLGCVVVSSPTIKKLNVDFFHQCQEFDYLLTINAPALRYLKVDRCSLKHITSLRSTMTSLIEANFSLDGDWSVDIDIEYTEYKHAVEFLNCLCNVKYLKISSAFEEKLVDIVGVGSMVKFDNLTKLEIGLFVDWYDFVKFLEVADNLELLILTLSGMFYSYREPKLVPTCILSSLKTVRFVCFYDFNEHDFETVRYLLKNAQVMERMEMYYIGNSNHKDHDEHQRIALFERGSKSCQLAYY